MNAEQLIKELARTDLSQDQRYDVDARLKALGKDAIGPLIAHLKDQKTARTRKRIVNEGELTNAPANLSAKGPAPEPIVKDEGVTLGAECERVLLLVITPLSYYSPYESRRKPISAGADQWMFRVENWQTWWAKNKSKPLAQIQEELKPVIDKYWQEHGTEQVVR